MRHIRMYIAVAASIATLTAVPAAPAQEQDAKVAAAAGRVDYLANQATEWSTLLPGQSVTALDQLRSGTSSWARLLFGDGSVVVVGPNSWLRVDEVSFASGKARVLLHLLGGQLRAVVSPIFPAQGRFEVETPTAVASVHGTEFVILYDADKEDTQVFSLRGEVEVLGVLGVLGRPVILTAGTTTTVRKGVFPTAATAASKKTLAALSARLELAVSPDDTLLVGFRGGHTPAVSEAPSSINEWPEEVGKKTAAVSTLRRLRRRAVSREGEIIDQPILEYTLTPPGQTPPGSVTVIINR